MESHGFPMCIHLSEQTVRALHVEGQKQHRVVPFGERKIKGKGVMRTYLACCGDWRAVVATAKPAPEGAAAAGVCATAGEGTTAEAGAGARVGMRSGYDGGHYPAGNYPAGEYPAGESPPGGTEPLSPMRARLSSFCRLTPSSIAALKGLRVSQAFDRPLLSPAAVGGAEAELINCVSWGSSTSIASLLAGDEQSNEDQQQQ